MVLCTSALGIGCFSISYYINMHEKPCTLKITQGGKGGGEKPKRVKSLPGMCLGKYDLPAGREFVEVAHGQDAFNLVDEVVFGEAEHVH